jgi:hypothetical protein
MLNVAIRALKRPNETNRMQWMYSRAFSAEDQQQTEHKVGKYEGPVSASKLTSPSTCLFDDLFQ